MTHPKLVRSMNPTPDDSRTTTLGVAQLNVMDRDAFCEALGAVVEHSPWVARQAWQSRPFASHAALFEAFSHAIQMAATAQKLALLRGHPELAGQEAVAGTMTAESNSEQGRLGLLDLQPSELTRLNELNRRYRERFGFPYVVALRLCDSLGEVFQGFEQRLCNDPETELGAALLQVCEVMRGRLARAVRADNDVPNLDLSLVSTPTRSLP